MKSKITLLTIIGVILFSNIASGDEHVVGHILPLPSELLAKPVKLKACPGFAIVEWKSSKDKHNTEQNEKTKKVIEDTCSISVKLFDEFIAKENLVKKNNNKLKITVSLLPWDVLGNGTSWGDGDGDDYRNLNDVDYRFRDSIKVTGPNGGILDIWGLTERKLDHLFIRNDPLNSNNEPNKIFIKVLSHEIFHTLSSHYGIFDSLGSNKQHKDEQLALKFDAFVLSKDESKY